MRNLPPEFPPNGVDCCVPKALVLEPKPPLPKGVFAPNIVAQFGYDILM